MAGTPHELVAFAAAFVAGAINSVAGGGTLVSFPALIWLGLPSTVANATSTVAIWPGSLGGTLGFRANLLGVERRMYALVLPSVTGGLAGAMLLRLTPTTMFDRLLPLLILFATGLFVAQDAAQRLVKTSRLTSLRAAVALQFFVAVYGGYFGAGLGIMMLAALGIIGLDDIHQMNGLKNLLAISINGVAALYFVAKGMVYWPDVLVMAIGAIAGGVCGAALGTRLGRVAVRRIVVVVGLVITVKMMFR